MHVLSLSQLRIPEEQRAGGELSIELVDELVFDVVVGDAAIHVVPADLRFGDGTAEPLGLGEVNHCQKSSAKSYV